MTKTDPAPQCTVSGGSGSTEAHFLDMRTTATRLDTSGDDATHLCRGVVHIGTSLPAKSAILSPGSALSVTTQIASLTLGLGGLALRMEFVARTLRWSATVYEITDTAQRAAFEAINVATTPVRASLYVTEAAAEALVTVGGSRDLKKGAAAYARALNRDLRFDPDFDDGFVSIVTGSLEAASYSAGGSIINHFFDTDNYEGQVGFILAISRELGLFKDAKPLSVKQTGKSTRPPKRRQLDDLVAEAAKTEHQSDGDHSVVHVRRVVGGDGKGAWVVAIPGTTHWNLKSDHGPSSTAANLASMAGKDSSLYPAIDKAVGAAMKEAGVPPGSEPVMVTGHSQGGIVAARLAADPHFRGKYDVREVLTAGSPIGRIAIPKSVNVLSIENVHDPVPRADGVPNPDTVNRTSVVCETPKGENLSSLIDAHDASGYARSAEELTRGRSERQVPEWYARNRRFLDGKDTDFTFHLRRDNP